MKEDALLSWLFSTVSQDHKTVPGLYQVCVTYVPNDCIICDYTICGDICNS